MKRFVGGVDVVGAGSVTAGEAATAGTDVSTAGRSADFAFLFFTLLLLFFFSLFSIVFWREETPRDV